jgi:hypothetical protein
VFGIDASAAPLHDGEALKITRRLRTALCLTLFALAGCGGNHGYTPDVSGAGPALLPDHSSSAKTISACTSITKSGTYVLKGNLTGSSQIAGPPCITIKNTSSVTFNCQNHTISGTAPDLLVNTVKGFTVENCNLQQPSSGNPLVTIESSSNGTVSGNTIGNNTETFPGWVDFEHDSAVTLASNALYFYLEARYSTGTIVKNNTFACGWAHSGPNEYCAALVNLYFGSKNQLTNNTLDGESAIDAPYYASGSDDIVNVGEEKSDSFTGNTMNNVWDCAIEIAFGSLTSSTISNNSITNASYCGIGGWYSLGLSNSTIANNTVSGSNSLLYFYRIGGLRAANVSYPGSPADTGVYFTNNTFTGNTLTNSYASSGNVTTFIPFDNNGDFLGYTPDGSGSKTPTPSQFHLTNNVFSGNDFGPSGPPYFGSVIDSGDVVDKGGNRCIPYSQPNFPLVCGAP